MAYKRLNAYHIFFFMSRSIAWELIMPISQYQRIALRHCFTVSCKSARPFGIKIPAGWGFSALLLLLKTYFTRILRGSYESILESGGIYLFILTEKVIYF